ncbi:MAG: hypothetical protein FWB72_04430 [Firmicutes bacterium]|nr:hypothetical protein [Bacillota bacterium]
MRKFKKIILILVLTIAFGIFVGCDNRSGDSDLNSLSYFQGVFLPDEAGKRDLVSIATISQRMELEEFLGEGASSNLDIILSVAWMFPFTAGHNIVSAEHFWFLYEEYLLSAMQEEPDYFKEHFNVIIYNERFYFMLYNTQVEFTNGRFVMQYIYDDTFQLEYDFYASFVVRNNVLSMNLTLGVPFLEYDFYATINFVLDNSFTITKSAAPRLFSGTYAISWSNVESAQKFVVYAYANGQRVDEFERQNLTLYIISVLRDIAKVADVNFFVRASGALVDIENRQVYVSSPLSQPVVFSITEVNIIEIDPPYILSANSQQITLNSQLFNWYNVYIKRPNMHDFEFLLNASWFEATIDIDALNINEGYYTLRIVRIGSTITTFVDGVLTKYASYSQPAEITLIGVSLTAPTNVRLQGRYLVWDSVGGTNTNFLVTSSYTNHADAKVGTNRVNIAEKFPLTSSGSINITLSVSKVLLDTSQNVITILNSLSVYEFSFMLFASQQPTNIVLDTQLNEITWQADTSLPNQATYTIRIGETDFVFSARAGRFSINYLGLENGLHSVSIRSNLLYQHNLLILDSDFTTPISFVISGILLTSPTNLMLDGRYLVWDSAYLGQADVSFEIRDLSNNISFISPSNRINVVEYFFEQLNVYATDLNIVIRAVLPSYLNTGLEVFQSRIWSVSKNIVIHQFSAPTYLRLDTLTNEFVFLSGSLLARSYTLVIGGIPFNIYLPLDQMRTDYEIRVSVSSLINGAYNIVDGLHTVKVKANGFYSLPFANLSLIFLSSDFSEQIEFFVYRA